MRVSGLLASSALVSGVLAAPAFAITPAEVWQSWQDLSASYGQTVTTESVEQDGSSIVVTGLVLVQEDEGARVEGRVDQITFADNGDGTVGVTMSDSFPLTMTVTEESGDPVTVSVTVNQPGAEITASGDLANTRYDFAMPELTVALDRIEGVDADALDLVAQAKLTEVAGNYLFGGPEDKRTLDSSFTAASMNLTLTGKDLDPSPAEGEEAGPTDMNFALGMADLSGSTTGTILSPALMADLQAAMAAGLAATASFAAGATTYDMTIVDATGTTTIAGTGESTSVDFGLDSTGIRYGTAAKVVDMTFSTPDLPFPEVKLSYAEAAMNLLVPLAQTEAPADFAFLTKLVDLTVSDEVWGIFDPGAVLPRDPATIVIDTKGKAKVTADLADPAAMSGGGAPGELHALDITELRAKMAGAELTGAGAFTFDNTDLVTFGGMPAPTGKLDLKLVGGNALMQKLVTLGFLSEEDMMGANMMLSMFANPGPGEDELTSVLEFKDKGFYANGQRLQ
ncbi:MAG: hypothetical protein RIR62_2178 [Pseudomonadota bacterium]